MKKRQRVFLTGASGTMGREGLRCLLDRRDRFDVVALVQSTERDRVRMEPFESEPGLKIIWGDLTQFADVLEGVNGADIVLHVGGVIPPLADHQPELAAKVNVGAVQNIIRAVRMQPCPDRCKLVYIGTVAQTGDRMPPLHWGRTGDPIFISEFDHYAVTKTVAERMVIESGLKHWVSLRQTGIAHVDLLSALDPIMFHVPLNGVLEWVTASDSGRLLANVCEDDVPDEFWRRIYNIGGGARFRVTNHEFMARTFAALGVVDFRDVTEPRWFATQNFHGQWFSDSDVLEYYLRFRREGVDDFIKALIAHAGWRRWAARLTPSALVKAKLAALARRETGTLDWIERGASERIRAFFGCFDEWHRIPGWSGYALRQPSATPVRLDHGYDESKPRENLDLADMQAAARFRGGTCRSAQMRTGDIQTPLPWRCAFGHEFLASPTLVLLAGHWCPHCLPAPWNYAAEVQRNPFLAQVWNVARPLAHTARSAVVFH